MTTIPVRVSFEEPATHREECDQHWIGPFEWHGGGASGDER